MGIILLLHNHTDLLGSPAFITTKEVCSFGWRAEGAWICLLSQCHHGLFFSASTERLSPYGFPFPHTIYEPGSLVFIGE